jgi:methionyl-tRNA formyltransferase
MNVLFAGTPEIAVAALRQVASRFPVVGVLTAPDAASGRGKRLTSPAVKVAADELGLPVLQPVRLDEDARAAVRNLGPDMLVSFAYGKIFGPKFMGIFPEGGINVHPSLLPKYRGPSPIPAVILAGESETGITVQYISQEMDAGAVVAQEHIRLTGEETTASLTGLVAEKAGDLLVEALGRIEEGAAEPVSQNEEEASYCKLIEKQDGSIDWARPAERIERMVRAYNPWPGAFSFWDEQKVTIWDAAVYTHSAAGDEPGQVIGVDRRWGILIQTGEGVLAVRRLQLQAGKPVDWKSFINGHQEFDGAVLGG